MNVHVNVNDAPVQLTATASDNAPIALDWFPKCHPERPQGAEGPQVENPCLTEGLGSARDDKAPILLVHGYAQNRYTFHHPTRSMAAHLAAGGRDVFVVELRGHGRSRAEGAPWPRGIRDYLDLDLPAAFSLIRGHVGAGRVVVIGHSLGGLLAQLYAGTHPDSVAGVCTLSAPSCRLGTSRLFRSPALRRLARFALAIRDRGLSGITLRILPSFPLDHLGALSFAAEEHLWARLPARFREGRRNPLMPVRPWREGSFEPAMERDRFRKGFDRTGLGVAVDILEWGTRGRIPGGPGEVDLLDRLSGVACQTLLISSPDDETIRARFTTQPDDLPAADVTAREIPGFGHCDLVLGIDAPAKVWSVIDAWLATL